jgi:hypothetical protein
MVNTLEESSSEMDMDQSPRCLEYPVINHKEPAEADNNNRVALVPANIETEEPRGIIQQDALFETLCT